MRDSTNSGYTKTGKKVKSIYGCNVDLIYNEVYDVFIDDDGEEFVIDEVGDWRYDSMESPSWLEVYDDVDNITENTLKS